MHRIRQQCTLGSEATVSGVGYIWGNDVQVRFLPSTPNSGVSFVRTDLPGRPRIAATIANVGKRSRRTSLETPDAKVEMVEHVLAALAGLGIDNCVVEIDAAETPGCDGSSLQFVEAIARAGVVPQPVECPAYVVQHAHVVQSGDSMIAILPPTGGGLTVSYNLDYGPESPIGRQSYCCEVAGDAFRTELAPARTFILAQEEAMLRAQGLGARSGSKDLLVFGPDGPIDNEQRFPNEPVRHKILDIVGDLSLLGRRLEGYVVAHKSGHRLNAELVKMLQKAMQPHDSDAESTIPLEDGGLLDMTQAA